MSTNPWSEARPDCDACDDTGRVPWYPFQQRNDDTDDQPCPDCAHFRGEVS
jgi:hypothetical protein